MPTITIQKRVASRLGEVVRGQLEAALSDIGEVAGSPRRAPNRSDEIASGNQINERQESESSEGSRNDQGQGAPRRLLVPIRPKSARSRRNRGPDRARSPPYVGAKAARSEEDRQAGGDK
jgi:hypothetical protein